MKRILIIITLALLLLQTASPAAETNASAETASGLAALAPDGGFTNSLVFELKLPEPVDIYFQAPVSNWSGYAAIHAEIEWPGNAPTNAQILAHMMDGDYFWYQQLLPEYLAPGTNHVAICLAPSNRNWLPQGHDGNWHLRALNSPREPGIRIFAREDFSGTAKINNIRFIDREKEPSPPYIRNVRWDEDNIRCHEQLEISFDIPDRYSNPFDSEIIRVWGEFTDRHGQVTVMDGFYFQDYMLRAAPGAPRMVPTGPPLWKIRFAPLTPGAYSFRILARDEAGTSVWGPAAFAAAPAENPGYIRVAEHDPRFFEFSSGKPFHAIGYNIRSPFDNRMDQRYPWADRHDEGWPVYERYFRMMGAHGLNMAEIWMASWSLGLEWGAHWYGYHGLTQYNMIHAWQMDRVVEAAEQHGIYLNVVINNHGKFSETTDREWNDNPFNIVNGGFLERPHEYFSDERAQRLFRELMRYKIARWGASPHIFAWKPFSEVNLTGSRGEPRPHQTRECREWYAMAGEALARSDPYRNMTCTHFSGDYKVQPPALIAVEQVDFCTIDAYHGSQDPLHIVQLMRDSSDFNSRFNKPMLATEFGGSHMGADVRHIEDTIHAANWSSAGMATAGTPMLWWWQLIEEENFFPLYGAFARFMEDVDRRDPQLLMLERPRPLDHTGDITTVSNLLVKVEYAPRKNLQITVDGRPDQRLRLEAMLSPRQAVGWIYDAAEFARIAPQAEAVHTAAELQIKALRNGSYKLETWDTRAGRAIEVIDLRVNDGTIKHALPPFTRDIAFKLLRTGPL